MQKPGQQPQQQGQSNAPVQTADLIKWASLAGFASGGVQAVLGVINGFDIVGFLMSVLIGGIVGILVAILLGQFGNKIPIQGTVMVRSALFMFALNLIAGLILGIGSGALGMIVGIVAIGGGSFLYGYIIQKQIPNLL